MNLSNATDQTIVLVTDSTKEIVGFLPKLFWAIVVILIGVLVAWAVKTIIVKGLKLIKIKPYTDAVGLNKVFPTQLDLINLVGDLVKWIIIIVFTIPAMEILGLSAFSVLLAQIVAYLPNIVIAVLILVVGAVLGDLLSRVVESTAHTMGAKTAAIAADIAKWTVIVFAILAALLQLGIATTIINQFVTGIVAMIAIAGGLAFGLGGQDAAKDAIDRLRKNLPK